MKGARAMTHRRATILIAGIFVSSIATVSAHVVRGLSNPSLATAHVSSPTTSLDVPIPVAWGGLDTLLRVACFNTVNTSEPSAHDPNWPRITAIGFELPGQLSGFSLMSPLDGDWDLVENVRTAVPNHPSVTLDFAVVARLTPAAILHKKPFALLGIPPGQERGGGTRFCVSGPFPPGMTIEQIINGVVVRFRRVQPHILSSELGVWENTANRPIPLYPD
jgi:hypothetical protein